MYRGSRLAASFLLFLSGSAITALGLAVLPSTIAARGPWILIPLVVAFGSPTSSPWPASSAAADGVGSSR